MAKFAKIQYKKYGDLERRFEKLKHKNIKKETQKCTKNKKVLKNLTKISRIQYIIP
jgi:hypothetical protein